MSKKEATNKWRINDIIQYLKDNNITNEALSSIAINSPLYGQMSLTDAINRNLKGYWDANEMKDLIDQKYTSYQDQKHTSDQQPKLKFYPVFTGYGGMQYASSPEEQAEMQKQANLNKASDPSENFLNDLMVFGPKTLTTVGKGLWYLGKGAYDLSKSLLQSIAEQGIKETGKRFAYQTGKELLKATPRFAGSIGGGFAVDKTSEALTGKTWGENASDFLSDRWGFKVSKSFGDMTNFGYYAGLNPRMNFMNRFSSDGFRIGKYSYLPDRSAIYSGLPFKFKATYSPRPNEGSLAAKKVANYQSLLDNQDNIVTLGNIATPKDIQNAVAAHAGKPIMFTTPSGNKMIYHNGTPYEVAHITTPITRQFSAADRTAINNYQAVVDRINKKYGVDLSIEARMSPRISMGGMSELDANIYKSHVEEYGQLMDELVKSGQLQKISNRWFGDFNGEMKPIDPFDYVRSHSKAFKNSGLYYDGERFISGMGVDDLDKLRQNGGVGYEQWSSNSNDVSSYYTRYSAGGNKRPQPGVQVDLVGTKAPTVEYPTGSKPNANNFRNGQSVRAFTTGVPGVVDLMQYLDNLSKGFGNSRVFGTGTQVKNFRFNNGDFDMNNLDIFSYNNQNEHDKEGSSRNVG